MKRNVRALLLLLLTLVACSTFFATHPTPAAGVTLYASTGDANAAGGGRIYKIDTDTLTVTLIGDTGLNRLGGIDFSPTGVLYGVDSGAQEPSALWTIDLTTAEPTFRGDILGVGSRFVQGVDSIRFDRTGTLYGAGWDASLHVIERAD